MEKLFFTALLVLLVLASSVHDINGAFANGAGRQQHMTRSPPFEESALATRIAESWPKEEHLISFHQENTYVAELLSFKAQIGSRGDNEDL
ncbi:hypothetical protein Cni_G01216 [Canna indica]|uniref:Uncharacterized protein n=1 Tax=Canna indica TaxID=4628 RepID=A0AAQ3JPS2_9LILI|nr:hypothetical protein Cni_G01216 [Canna indica]